VFLRLEGNIPEGLTARAFASARKPDKITVSFVRGKESQTMNKQGVRIATVIAFAVLFGTGASGPRLLDRWENPEFEKRKFVNLLVIGITDDRQARHGFEDLFVSHLRGKGIDGVTSHSLVPSLGSVDNEKALLAILEDREVDGAITIRAVPLKKLSESEWAEQWRAAVASDQTIRELIDDTLPLEGAKAKHYGIEVVLWDVENRQRVWGARSTPYTVKKMRKGTGSFVQMVMRALEYAELLPSGSGAGE
jgi:hypothetical protein